MQIKVCPCCKGKGYTLESNTIDFGLFGICYDIFDGLKKIRCKSCCGTGVINESEVKNGRKK